MSRLKEQDAAEAAGPGAQGLREIDVELERTRQTPWRPSWPPIAAP